MKSLGEAREGRREEEGMATSQHMYIRTMRVVSMLIQTAVPVWRVLENDESEVCGEAPRQRQVVLRYQQVLHTLQQREGEVGVEGSDGEVGRWRAGMGMC